MTKTLPPDPEGKNDDRAEWAGDALGLFRRMTGADHEDALGDLLCDLMHWSDRANFDFEAALFRAQGHYQAETEGEDASDLLDAVEIALERLEIGNYAGEEDAYIEQIKAAIAKAKGGAA